MKTTKLSSKLTLLVVTLLLLGVFVMVVASLGANQVIAQADTPVFSITSITPSKTAKETSGLKVYYNNNGNLLAVNDTFDVVYTINTGDTTVIGFEINLYNAGFTVTGAKVGSDAVSTGTYSATSGNGTFTFTNGFQAGTTAKVIVDYYPAQAVNQAITITYKLAEEISVCSSKTISASGDLFTAASGASSSMALPANGNATIYVRSTTSITTPEVTNFTYDGTTTASLKSGTGVWSNTANDSSHTAPTPTTKYKLSTEEDSAYTTTAPKAAGTYNVQVSTESDDYYEAATSTAGSFTIAQKDVTIAAENKTSVYSEAIVALTCTGDNGFVAADSMTVSYTTKSGENVVTLSTSSDAGTYTIVPSATGTGSANYNITYTNGTYTITRHYVTIPTVTIFHNGSTTGTTITAGTPESKSYTGSAYTLDYTADTGKYTASGSTEITNVGSIALTLAVDKNYYWGNGTANETVDTNSKVFTLFIEQAGITIKVSHAAITYRDAVPTTGFDLTYDGTFATADESTWTTQKNAAVGTQTNFTTNYTQYSPVGDYNVTLADAVQTTIKNALPNYNITFTGAGLLTVNKLTLTPAATWVQSIVNGDTISSNAMTVTYDNASHGIVFNAVTGENKFGSTQVVSVVYGGGEANDTNASAVNVNIESSAVAARSLTATFSLATGNDDQGKAISDNYAMSSSNEITVSLTINKAAVTITPKSSQTHVYGATPSDLTADVTGTIYKNGEVDEVTYTLKLQKASADVTLDATLGADTYKIIVTPAYATNEEKNYNVTTVNTVDYVVTKAELTATADAKNVTYGDAAPTYTVTYSGFKNSDTASNVTITGTVTYNDPYTQYTTDVGAHTITPDVSNLSAANYSFKAANGTLTVAAKTVTLTVTAGTSLVYNSASQNIYSVTANGLVNSQTLNFAYTLTGTTGSSASISSGMSSSPITLGSSAGNITATAAGSYSIYFTAITDGTGKASNYSFTAQESTAAVAATIAKATLTWADATVTGATASWSAPTNTVNSGIVPTFTYSLKVGETEKLTVNTATSYTAQEAATYILAVTLSDTDNFNTIDSQTLTSYSATFQDLKSDHSLEAFASAPADYTASGNDYIKVLYAFSGEKVTTPAALSLTAYTFGGWKTGETTVEAATATAALTGNVTYTAVWTINKYNVSYKFKIAGASAWEDYSELVESNSVTTFSTTYNDALKTVPSRTWFVNNGWHNVEACSDTAFTNMTVKENTTFYTIYYFNIGVGDVNGDGTISAADITLMRQYLAGGYITEGDVITTVEGAWTASKNSSTSGKFLTMVANVNNDTDSSSNAKLNVADVVCIRMAVNGTGNPDYFKALEGKCVVTTSADKATTDAKFIMDDGVVVANLTGVQKDSIVVIVFNNKVVAYKKQS